MTPSIAIIAADTCLLIIVFVFGAALMMIILVQSRARLLAFSVERSIRAPSGGLMLR
jgi:hypothetical protein